MAQGKRAGARRGEKRRTELQPHLLRLALAITVLVVAWGYLVYAAIDFGASARGGESTAWWFVALASIGAVACLFTGLMLVARLLRAMGLTSSAPPPPPRNPRDAEPAVPGGRRASR